MTTATDLMMLGNSVTAPKAGGGSGVGNNKGGNGRNSGEESAEVGAGGGLVGGGNEKAAQLPPRIRPDVDLNDNTLFAVYCFIKNFIGASGTSAVAIDNKIEQAMDLVKSHLMFAVREEVEVLKEKIAELMERINQLEAENSILKANASTETLAQLGGGGQAQAS